MNSYQLYNDARTSIQNLISNREEEIQTIEKEIVNLKNTRRMIDEEFNNSMNKKEKYLG